ncbi:MAG: hypothetical protein Q9173_001982 [Seirophora scorigena]
MLSSTFLLPLLLPLTTSAAETVLGLYIFSRHGDRTPKSIPPARLTHLGYSQSFTSGTYFRNRYVAPDAPSRVAGVSGDLVEYAQITASAPLDTVLMGSAQGPTVGSETLRDGRIVRAPLDGYQLIPIQTVTSGAGSEDTAWLQGSSNCAQAIVSSNEYFSSSDYSNLLASTGDFYESLTPLINATFDAEDISYKNAYTIFDLLNVASIHNASIPNSFTNSTLSRLSNLANHHEFNLAYNTSAPIRAVAGSTLAAQILQGLNNTIATQGKSKITVEFGAYASFLSFFGLADLTTVAGGMFYGIPDYASTMTFELFTATDTVERSFPNVEDLQVRFLFHNGTTDEGSQPVAYPLFGQQATELNWRDFEARMKRFAIGSQAQWCKACGNSTGVCASAAASMEGADVGDGASNREGRGVAGAVAGTIGAMVTLAVVLAVEGAVLLLAGLRVVRKNRWGRDDIRDGMDGSESATLSVRKG